MNEIDGATDTMCAWGDTAEAKHLAALQVCAHAHDLADALLLFDVVGLNGRRVRLSATERKRHGSYYTKASA